MSNRFFFVLKILLLAGALLLGGTGMGQEPNLAPEEKPVDESNLSVAEKSLTLPLLTSWEHPWGRFAPTSWCCMQTITWTSQDGRRIGTVGETRTTLDSIEEDGITLREVSTVEVGGKRIQTAAKKNRFDFFQQRMTEETKISDAEPTKLLIGNLVVPCEVRVYETSTSSGNLRVTLWYSTRLYPYILRTERILRSVPTEKEPEEKILSQTVREVVDSDAFRIRTCKLGSYRLRTTKQSGNITTITESLCSRNIPGGVHREFTRELDRNGREIRSVESRLINHFTAAQPPIPIEGFMGGFMDDATPFFEPIPWPMRPRWRRFQPVPIIYGY